jgi:hypothetical protein
MCQYIIGSVRTPHCLIICRRSVIYFLSMYVKNKIHTYLYTIFAIILLTDFLSPKIKPVLKCWGVTRKSLASLFEEMKTCVQCKIQEQKLDPWWEINKHIVVFTHQFYRLILNVYNDVHQFSNNRAFVA